MVNLSQLDTEDVLVALVAASEVKGGDYSRGPKPTLALPACIPQFLTAPPCHADPIVPLHRTFLSALLSRFRPFSGPNILTCSCRETTTLMTHIPVKHPSKKSQCSTYKRPLFKADSVTCHSRKTTGAGIEPSFIFIISTCCT